jgi:hypothetical protein
LGIWPFTDVFRSTETDNLLVATLSAGPVGVGDRIGALDAPNLLRAVRPDGVIVKPDVPLAPHDRAFLQEARSPEAPLIASTYSAFGKARTVYLFAYTRGAENRISFTLREAGLDMPAYVYDYFSGAGRLASPDEPQNWVIANDWKYAVAAPVGLSGMAVLGDTGHFVSMGRKRVSAFHDNGRVLLTVAFAPGEAARIIEGYSPDAPVAEALSGSAGPVVYDPAIERFRLTVMPGAEGTSTIRIWRAEAGRRPPLRDLTP